MRNEAGRGEVGLEGLEPLVEVWALLCSRVVIHGWFSREGGESWANLMMMMMMMEGGALLGLILISRELPTRSGSFTLVGILVAAKSL